MNNISNEITDKKLLIFQKKKEKKNQSEKPILYDFVSILSQQNQIELFKLEKRIVIALDNTKIHKAILAKKSRKNTQHKINLFSKIFFRY